MLPNLTLLIAIVLLFILSATFSGTETAFMSLDHLQSEKLSKKRVVGRYIRKLKSNPRRFIITVLIGNNIVNIVLTILTTMLFIDLFGDLGPAIATGVLTFMLLTFGEIFPKTYASANNEALVSLVAIPFYYLQRLLRPLTILFELMTETIFFRQRETVKELFGDMELETALDIGVKQKSFSEMEREVILRYLKIDDTPAHKVMIPIKDVFSLSERTTVEKAVDEISEKVFSRVPIYGGKKTNITGFVHVKDLLDLDGKDDKKPLSDFKRDILRMNENRVVGDVLKEMMNSTIHMSVVKDEDEKAVGIITQEDIFEEFLGEIYDETDKESGNMIEMDKRQYIIEASEKLEHVDDIFRQHIPEDYHGQTLANFMKRRIKGIRKGASTRIKGLRFVVHELDKDKKIKKVRIVRRL